MDCVAHKLLKKVNFKVTSQRKVIADVLFSSEDHLNADEIFKIVSGICSTVSFATIYRTLALFEEAGIIKKLDLGDGKSRYEVARSEKGHHHHLIDIETGKIIEFYDQELEDLKTDIARRLGYKLVDHRLELYGVPLKNESDT